MEAREVTVKKYEQFYYDEEADEETDEFEGWSVFSTIVIDERTSVRAVADSVTGKPTEATVPDWFVEWYVKDLHVTCRVTAHMDQESAVSIGDRAAALLAERLDQLPRTGRDAAAFLVDLARTIDGSIWQDDPAVA